MTAVVVVATIRPLPEHRAELHQALRGRLEDAPDVQVLQPHPAGTPAQGSL